MSSQRKATKPLILHCHIPKTAGTTISAGFRKTFEFFHLHHYHPDPFYILSRETLEGLLEIFPDLRSISSHHLRSFPLAIGALLYEYFRAELLGSHRDLRKRRWLGFRPAAADARHAFSNSWRDGAQSLINSAYLYSARHADHIEPLITPPLRSDLLELRAAEAVASCLEANHSF